MLAVRLLPAENFLVVADLGLAVVLLVLLIVVLQAADTANTETSRESPSSTVAGCLDRADTGSRALGSYARQL